MARLNTPINTEELERKATPEADFSPIPEGRYNAMITGCTLETKLAGDPKIDNEQLHFKFRIQDGEFAKRIVFWQVWHTYNNMKPAAEGIASRMLSNLCKAIGMQGQIEDTDDFINKECQIQVTKELNNSNKEVNGIDGNKFEPLPQNIRGTVQNSAPTAPSHTASAYSASNPPAAPRRRG